MGTVVKGGVRDPAVICNGAIWSGYADGRALRQNLAGSVRFGDSFVIEGYIHSTSRSRAWVWLVKLIELPGASPLDKSYMAMESRRSSESQSASPYGGLPRQILMSKGLRRGCTPKYATARPRFRLGTFLPIIDVTASDIGRLLASSFS
jgi:hypothetical protein